MFRYLKPSSTDDPFEGMPVPAESLAIEFNPTMTFNQFANYLVNCSNSIPRAPSAVESISERIKICGELGLISDRLCDVGYMFAEFGNVFKERNLKLPDILEYNNSVFDGTTLTTEPRVSLQKICDYLTTICDAIQKQPTPKSWNLADTAELLYLVGIDAIDQEGYLFKRIDAKYSQAGEEAGVQLRGRISETTKQQLWEEVSIKLPDGLKFLIK